MMISEVEFIQLLNLNLGLALAQEQWSVDFDEINGWDSLYLLRVLTVLEREMSVRLSVADLLSVRSLSDIYAMVVANV